MNSITTNSATNHVDHIARLGGLVVTLAAVGQYPGHYTHSPTVNKWLADIALIEHHCSIDCRDT